MKKIMRLTAVFLLFAIAIGSMASCKNKKGEDIDNDTAPSQELNLSGEASDFLPKAKDYDREFVMLTSENGSGEQFYLYFNEENSYTGEAISDALYGRQLLMQELYGVELRIKVEPEFVDTVSTAYLSGEYICDITMVPAVNTFSLALDGVYANLLDLDSSINFEASYWDQRIQEEYRIDDMLFTLEGDYTIADEFRTLVVLYNQTVYETYNYSDTYGSPYSMVDNHTWTYDTMLTMIADISKDLNMDDEMNEKDMWGMVSELTAVYYFFLGAGLKTMENNNGQLVLNLTDSTQYSQIYDVIENTMKLSFDKDVLMVNRPGAVSEGGAWDQASQIFENDRALYRATTLSAVNRLRAMASDYGILPIPAYYDNQTEYYCWVSGNTHMPLAIYRYSDVVSTAEITERLAYHSRYGGTNTLYSAFFEKMAYNRICRTPDDINMLELVIDSKTFDVDQSTKITGVESTLYSLARAENYTSLSSSLESLKSISEAKLKAYLMYMTMKNTVD